MLVSEVLKNKPGDVHQTIKSAMSPAAAGLLPAPTGGALVAISAVSRLRSDIKVRKIADARDVARQRPAA